MQQRMEQVRQIPLCRFENGGHEATGETDMMCRDDRGGS